MGGEKKTAETLLQIFALVGSQSQSTAIKRNDCRIDAEMHKGPDKNGFVLSIAVPIP